ncbi:hypothetical protein CC85DRAFT_299658 [Cutaneotrichosporon oleaginosum]|uniref:Uncharacterized protein n=1 Tax=Cutaneotrichosporon oleaginosum TaxID=879819 RepID=A0A0J0XVS3_9TREE|nr:uncharacterized protein CC85DRAFT_299658 [Cutaneotrichosporon oleaginosum]KLT45190.1 hypothetical protein CC85DRAFT_299658 [Cutaneotrichosporon oleaginosum]TXT14974.1 hypothetical protein COLE_01167 [Cutaneotrichosporon oleaginosum]
MSAPAPAKQLYLGPSGGQPEPQGLFSYIWNEQIMNPAHREGNLNIARAVGLFAAGILFVRSDLASALVPVF